MAAQNDSRRAVKLLVKAGADLDAPKEGGFTPVAIATLRNRKECLQALLEGGADVNRAYTVADKFTPADDRGALQPRRGARRAQPGGR